MTGETKTDYGEFIPDMSAWNDGKGIDIDDWISCVGDPAHAIGYARLFWPTFCEHDGCVFFEHLFLPENYAGFMQQTGGDRRAVEAVINHRHLLTIFGDPALPTRAQLIHLGQALQEMWSAKLHRDFPGRRFAVRLLELDAEDLMDLQITFTQTEGAG